MPRSRIVAVLVLLIALGGLITLPLIARGQRIAETPNIGISVPSNDIPFYTEPPCADTEPHSYFDDPKEDPSLRAFGPAAPQDTADNTANELFLRLCGRSAQVGGDRNLYRAIISKAEGTDPNLPLSDSEWRTGVRTLVHRYIDWSSAELVERTSPEGTYSMYMEKLASGEIKIGAVEVKPRTSWFLKIKVFNGITHVELLLRLSCGFQPEDSRDKMPTALL